MSHRSINNRHFCSLAVAITLTAGVVNALVARVSSAQKSGSAGSRVIDTVIQQGHRSYSQYNTPVMCLEAVGRIRLNATRMITSPPITNTDPATDPLPDSVGAAAKQCLRQFSAASVAPSQLLEYMELALTAGNDAEAMAAMERWRATMPTDPDNRGWALLTLIDIFDKVPPVHLPVVEKLTAELNALGAPAAVQRMKAESWWIRRSWALWDTAAIEQHSYAYLKAYAEMSPDRSRRWTQFLVNGPGASWASYMAAQYPVVGDMQGGVTLARLKAATNPTEVANLRTRIKEQTGASLSDAELNLMSIYQLLSTPVVFTPIPATTWFGAHGPHEWPVRGRVSLYVTLFPQSDAEPGALYALLRHVQQKFGDRVNMTIVYKTQGFFREGPPMDPAAEAEAARKYFLDDLKLPVNLAIIRSGMDTLPDGRLMARPTAMETTEPYVGPREFAVGFYFGIADGKGMSVWRSPSPLDREAELDTYLERAIRQSAGASQ